MHVGADLSLWVAVFPLRASGGAVCLQLQDEGKLRRGGVYLLEVDEAEHLAFAPRFDELFADLAAKVSQQPEFQAPMLALLERAHALARRCHPRLTAETLAELGDLALEGAALTRAHPELPGSFTPEALLLIQLLIFVSEEERYPRPRYRGGDVAWERLRETLPACSATVLEPAGGSRAGEEED